MQKLDELGYVNYEKYRGLILTDMGREVARRIQRRHQTLRRFFSLLGLADETQLKDIEGIEHHLSSETLRLLSDLADYFSERPESREEFLRYRTKKAD